ncbi:MAG: hypothetical protein A2097_07500 [Desulfobacula sp. GWF2_41_7]|nr:MAG: hypothetical protein A2097_07500 [Desulfobacula sp. GWF2_41_7]
MNKGRTTVSIVADIAGISSLFIAILQSNIKSLTDTQKWGLAIVAAATIFTFIFISQIRIVTSLGIGHRAKRLGIILITGIIGSGLLLIFLPFLRFEVADDLHDQLVYIVSTTFFAISAVWIVGICIRTVLESMDILVPNKANSADAKGRAAD